MDKLFYSFGNGCERISSTDLEEIMLKDCSEQIPTAKASVYKLTEDSKHHFNAYDITNAQKIVFINPLCSNISEEMAIKILKTMGENIKILSQRAFPKKNSAQYIGLILS